LSDHLAYRIDRRTGLLVPLAAFLFAAGAVAGGFYVRCETTLRRDVALGNARIVTAERLESALKDVETGERGYVITGQDSFLEPYHAGRRVVAQMLATLAQLGAGDSDLPPLVAQKITYSEQLVALRRQGAVDDAKITTASGRGKMAMDAARAAMARFKADQQQQMDRADAAQSRRGNALLIATITAMAGCFVAGALAAHLRQESERASRRGLALSEARFRKLIEASATITWLMAPEGGFTEPQESWTAFTDQPFETIRGNGWMHSVHPDDRAELAKFWPQAMAEGMKFVTEHRLLRRDGTWRNMLARAVPVRDDNGALREWVGTHTDITEQRHAEAELITAKESAEDANRAKSQFLANMSHELRTPLSAVIGYSEMLAEEIEDMGATALLADVGKIRNNARHLLSLINDVLDISKIEADRMTAYAEDFAVW